MERIRSATVNTYTNPTAPLYESVDPCSQQDSVKTACLYGNIANVSLSVSPRSDANIEMKECSAYGVITNQKAQF